MHGWYYLKISRFCVNKMHSMLHSGSCQKLQAFTKQWCICKFQCLLGTLVHRSAAAVIPNPKSVGAHIEMGLLPSNAMHCTRS